ncbi:DUF2812 domain-containing protein [Clostridium sp. YIM B02515]|uniref:DUF2812 domain-containing protein n=1 Tax=Clostridium rhizosphaerae TaxID=2803861 RepID=A0ABS1TAP8_9CLOT|nr:DUF2812 domain-containing protein [Clostridium rhizosphaerae]MBL4936422.1 DUF2812 domain-containing protein [Clostridium rhizosphaerae]
MWGKGRKIVFLNLLPYECGAAEEYLSKMAQRGWLLKNVKGTFLIFKRSEPKILRYSVDVLNKISIFDHKDSDEALEYREYCEAAGWNYVCQKGKIQIFCTEEQNEAVSIHTDEQEKLKAVFKASFYDVGMQILLTLIFVFNLYVSMVLGNSSFILSSNMGLLSETGMLILIAANIIEITSFIIWFVKNKIRVKDNKLMVFNDYKRVKAKNIIKISFSFVILLLWIAILVYDDSNGDQLNIIMFVMMLALILIAVCVKWFINNKRYSRNTNRGLLIGGNIILIYLMVSVIGIFAFRQVIEGNIYTAPMETANLTIEDFGYKDGNNSGPHFMSDKSVLAQEVEYFSDNDDNRLSYNILQSPYPLVIKFYQNRLISWHNRYDNELNKESTSLPDNIKVYRDKKKRIYIFVSHNKVIDAIKELKDTSDEEFIDKVYDKLIKNQEKAADF